MALLGNIPYYTLENGVEKEWNALNIYSSPSTTTGLAFAKPRTANPRIKKEYGVCPYIDNLASIVRVAINRVHSNFLPLFGRRAMDSIVQEIVCESTHFEQENFFNAMFFNAMKYLSFPVQGVYYSKPSINYDGKPIPAGAHIRIANNTADLNQTLLHEYGHGMHWQSCAYNLASFSYTEYDDCMGEVMAIALVGKYFKPTYDKEPHKTANELLAALMNINKIKALPFHKRWEFLLQFANYGALQNSIYNLQKEREYEKLAEIINKDHSFFRG